MQVTLPWGAFALVGDAGQGGPSATQAWRHPCAGLPYLGRSGRSGPGCGPWLRPQALAPCRRQKHLQEEPRCPATRVLPLPQAILSGPLSAGMEPVSQKGDAVAVVPELLPPGPYPWMAPLSPVVTIRQVWVEPLSWGRKNGGRVPAGMTECSREALITDFLIGVGFTKPIGD